MNLLRWGGDLCHLPSGCPRSPLKISGWSNMMKCEFWREPIKEIYFFHISFSSLAPCKNTECPQWPNSKFVPVLHFSNRALHCQRAGLLVVLRIFRALFTLVENPPTPANIWRVSVIGKCFIGTLSLSASTSVSNISAAFVGIYQLQRQSALKREFFLPSVAKCLL